MDLLSDTPIPIPQARLEQDNRNENLIDLETEYEGWVSLSNSVPATRVDNKAGVIQDEDVDSDEEMSFEEYGNFYITQVPGDWTARDIAYLDPPPLQSTENCTSDANTRLEGTRSPRAKGSALNIEEANGLSKSDFNGEHIMEIEYPLDYANNMVDGLQDENDKDSCGAITVIFSPLTNADTTNPLETNNIQANPINELTNTFSGALLTRIDEVQIHLAHTLQSQSFPEFTHSTVSSKSGVKNDVDTAQGSTSECCTDQSDIGGSLRQTRIRDPIGSSTDGEIRSAKSPDRSRRIKVEEPIAPWQIMMDPRSGLEIILPMNVGERKKVSNVNSSQIILPLFLQHAQSVFPTVSRLTLSTVLAHSAPISHTAWSHSFTNFETVRLLNIQEEKLRLSALNRTISVLEEWRLLFGFAALPEPKAQGEWEQCDTDAGLHAQTHAREVLEKRTTRALRWIAYIFDNDNEHVHRWSSLAYSAAVDKVVGLVREAFRNPLSVTDQYERLKRSRVRLNGVVEKELGGPKQWLRSWDS